MTPQHVLPESTVLVAYEGERIVGTLTVTLDSPAGLPLDKDYPEELDALRRREARIVEYGSYAVVRRCWHSGVTHLLCMAAYHFARYSLAGTHCVVGVHPRALPLYRAVYNFGPLGEVKEHAELAAPVQGLVQDMAAVQPFFKRRFRKPMSSGLKVWEHFIDVLPRCVQVPAFRSLDELVRWKLPRTVFQELFIERSDRLATIDGRVRSQLEGWRSIHTVQPARRPRVRPALRVVKGGQTERYTALGAS